VALAGVFSARMFGLFLLLPVLALHVAGLPGGTTFLAGLALGIYGLTQAVFQLPLGMLSDHFGRKRIITFGLLVFIAGSIVAALADSAVWLVAGRALQGAGAVSSAVLALTADLTREEQRTKAMALIGMSIGAVFLLSMALAPPLSEIIGVDGLLWGTAVLGGLALVLLHLVVPTPTRHLRHRDVTPMGDRIAVVLKNTQLLRLDSGIFVLHLVLTALFVVLPAELGRLSGLALGDHWTVYLPVMLASVLGMAPLVIVGSKPGMVEPMFRLAIGILLTGLVAMVLVAGWSLSGLFWLPLALWIFFSGFNALEAMLPSLVSRVAPAADKGTAIGIYNTLQFLGVFVGGSLAGWLSGRYGVQWVYLLCALLVLGWLVVSLVAPAFHLFSSRVIHIGDAADSSSHLDALVDRIRGVRGVQEVTIVRGEALAYLKVDDRELDIAALQQLDQKRGD
jgi:MFS family permease